MRGLLILSFYYLKSLISSFCFYWFFVFERYTKLSSIFGKYTFDSTLFASFLSNILCKLFSNLAFMSNWSTTFLYFFFSNNNPLSFSFSLICSTFFILALELDFRFLTFQCGASFKYISNLLLCLLFKPFSFYLLVFLNLVRLSFTNSDFEYSDFVNVQSGSVCIFLDIVADFYGFVIFWSCL